MLQDKYGTPAPSGLSQYPLLDKMPRTTLTTEESNQIDQFAELLYGDYWYKGIHDQPLTAIELDDFWTLGNQIMTEEGFSAFYQNTLITGKLQE